MILIPVHVWFLKFRSDYVFPAFWLGNLWLPGFSPGILHSTPNIQDIGIVLNNESVSGNTVSC